MRASARKFLRRRTAEGDAGSLPKGEKIRNPTVSLLWILQQRRKIYEAAYLRPVRLKNRPQWLFKRLVECLLYSCFEEQI